MKRTIARVRNFYARFERPISSFSLVAGFVFDAVTLKRVDMFWENFWVVAHLLIVAVFIILINVTESHPGDEHDPERAHFWYVNILQFFFGGLLSTYLVFYFRSADILVSWPFILLLVLAFWANESLKHHYARLSFQVSLFFLSLFSFTIFLLPVLMHSIGPGIFLLSGAVSLALISVFMLILKRWGQKRFEASKRIVMISVASIFVVINIFYFTDIIPPIPLSLKDADVYHSIQKDGADYVAVAEPNSWKNYFTFFPDFHVTKDEPAYVYSAVFSPANLNITIFHRWQYYNDKTEQWIDAGLFDLKVIGGREGGYRTYSSKNNLTPGKWRVNVETDRGQVIGRVRFTVVNAESTASNFKTI